MGMHWLALRHYSKKVKDLISGVFLFGVCMFYLGMSGHSMSLPATSNTHAKTYM